MNIRERLVENTRFKDTCRPDFPTNMLVELTNACNHRCVFCANRKMTRPAGHIDDAFLRRLLREAFQLGVREVGFYTTGEPFASPHLPQYVAESKRLGYTYVYVTTNGSLATPERAKAVIEAGIDSIKFSINAGTGQSYRRIHGSDDFDRVIANLRFVAEYRTHLDRRPYLYVSCVLTRQTQHERDVLRALLTPLVDDVLFFNVGNQGGLMFEVNKCLTLEGTNLVRRPPCPMVFNRVHISYEGYMTACCVDYQNYLALADLNALSLREAWHGERFRLLREKHLTNDLLGTLCYNCLFNADEIAEPLVPQLATRYDRSAFSTEKEILRRLEVSGSDCGPG